MHDSEDFYRVEGSSPRWRLQSKCRNGLDDRVREQTQLRHGLSVFVGSSGAGDVPADGALSPVGKRTFEPRFGAEMPWARKPRLPLPPPPDKSAGKRLGINPSHNRPPDGRAITAHLLGPEAAEAAAKALPRGGKKKLVPLHDKVPTFEKEERAHNRSKRCAAQPQAASGEALPEHAMMRKKGSFDRRNGVPVSTLGDKPYADPSYSAKYWQNSAASLPKCGLEPIPHRADHLSSASFGRSPGTFEGLLQLPKDPHHWDFLKEGIL
ncbi:hypothetical protein DIPPA_01015 [Diplonema papillatum]|nr:hypothetical protein DIPPA_01015 [Diplonema papillatum]